MHLAFRASHRVLCNLCSWAHFSSLIRPFQLCSSSTSPLAWCSRCEACCICLESQCSCDGSRAGLSAACNNYRMQRWVFPFSSVLGRLIPGLYGILLHFDLSFFGLLSLFATYHYWPFADYYPSYCLSHAWIRWPGCGTRGTRRTLRSLRALPSSNSGCSNVGFWTRYCFLYQALASFTIIPNRTLTSSSDRFLQWKSSPNFSAFHLEPRRLFLWIFLRAWWADFCICF